MNMIAVAIMGMALAQSGGGPSSQASASPACEAAEALIEASVTDIAVGALVDGPAPPFRGRWKNASELKAGGWTGQPPTAELLDAWQVAAGENVLACPSIRTSPARSKGASVSRGETHLVGLPIVDDTGYEAIAQVSITKPSPEMGGSVHLYLLQKFKTGWRVVSRRMIAIS